MKVTNTNKAFDTPFGILSDNVPIALIIYNYNSDRSLIIDLISHTFKPSFAMKCLLAEHMHIKY